MHIQDHFQEQRLFTRRVLVALVGVCIALLILIGRLVQLQILDHTHFTTLSKDNRVRLEPLPPTRGLIYDRNGQILAQNRPSYSLEMIPEQVTDIPDTLERLSNIIPITEQDHKRFNRLQQRKRRFDRIPIRVNLHPTEAAQFAVVKHQFPGVDIQARLIRHYPNPAATAHVLGYVGRISKQDLEQLPSSNYAGTIYTGKTGLEKTYEALLHGEVGTRHVEVNAVGRVARILKQQVPQPGQDLYLHLDSELQQVALDAFGEHNGAVVAMDPNTGGILAMVSKPTYDPNLFVQGISHSAYQALRTNPDQPLYDRALRVQYPPGSTIKPFIGLAGLETEQIHNDHRLYCRGSFQLPGHEHKYRDWKKWGHGLVTLDDAITQSCDVYFYRLAHEMGVDKLSEYLATFGFGTRTGIDLTGEARGILPSRAWKQQARSLPWYPGETIIMGIGQGYFLSTPLQLAAATAAIANGGIYHTPRLVQYQQPQGTDTKQHIASEQRQIPIQHSQHWEDIRTAMVHVVEHPRGTGKKIQHAGYRIAGKTGTAQVFSIKQDEEYDEATIAKKKRDHALFIAYAPVEDPQIALAVIIENGGNGSTVAAPVARIIMDAYLGNRGRTAVRP